jgi:hypothetical protein
MIAPDPSPPDRAARDLARQRTILKAMIGVLLLGGVAVLAFARQLPLPLRIFSAATDLVTAAVLWLVYRQKFSGRSS